MSVNLSWTASTDVVDGYNVYRGTAAGAETNKLNTTPVTATSFVDQNPPVGQEFYAVKSVKGGIESVFSNEVSVTVPLPPPAPPTKLVATLS